MRGLKLLILTFAGLLAGLQASAQYRDDQFKRDAFSQNYADTTQKAPADSAQLFSFKEYFGGLAHKRNASLKCLTMGSTIFIGGNQIYQKQYWKLPIIYGGIGAGIGMGVHFGNQYKNTGDERYKAWSTISYVGAGMVWWGSLLDGAVQYDRKGHRPNPAKSTVYSLLLPGMGQIYNGEAWKVPIYYGLMAGSVHFLVDNNVQYNRWKTIHNLATDESVTEKPPQSGETAKYYRDLYRRYRDYSILALTLSYLLQVIDANVFAYMQDFEVNDDISLHIEPSLTPQTGYAMAPAVGMSIGIRF